VGHVFVKGALWRARTDSEHVEVGDEVVVRDIDGLTLTVAPAGARPEGPAEGVQSAQ
jgi:membrane protein implicated in regulation of membrane protease activity